MVVSRWTDPPLACNIVWIRLAQWETSISSDGTLMQNYIVLSVFQCKGQYSFVLQSLF